MVDEFEAVVSKQGDRHIVNVPARKRKKFKPGNEVKVRKMKGGK